MKVFETTVVCRWNNKASQLKTMAFMWKEMKTCCENTNLLHALSIFGEINKKTYMRFHKRAAWHIADSHFTPHS